MNLSILNPDVQEFINSNLDSDITKLLLKGSTFNDVSIKEIVEQIEAKKKCEYKLPSWFTTNNIYYPNKLNIEQTSSEATAKYKASLISGNTILDVTGGFGVDSFYFSKKFKNITHCEINKSLSKIVKHNFKQLNVNNIDAVSCDGIELLSVKNKKYDWIYIDPSRRHDSKGKVFFLTDCLPNVPEYLELLFESSNNIMIKTSPLLDLSIGINELKYVKTIYVVALNNEVKELLWVLEKDCKEDVLVETINLKKPKNEKFTFSLKEESTAQIKFSKPLTYLYEPNSAILKSGGFNSIANNLKVNKLHKHSHLYTSENLISNFPGRQFIIESVMLYSKKNISLLKVKKANITTRNFPETVSQLRNKFKILDGGNMYLFFTVNLDNKKIVIVSTKA